LHLGKKKKKESVEKPVSEGSSCTEWVIARKEKNGGWGGGKNLCGYCGVLGVRKKWGVGSAIGDWVLKDEAGALRQAVNTKGIVEKEKRRRSLFGLKRGDVFKAKSQRRKKTSNTHVS